MVRTIAAVLGCLVVTGGAAQALPTLSDPTAPPPAGSPPAPVSPAPAAAPAPAPAPAVPRAPAPTPSSTTPLEKAFDQPVVGSSSGGEKYVGVIPGPEAQNPLPKAKKTPPRLIWSGFKSGDGGGSQVFFQTNQPVTFEVVPDKSGSGKALSVFLRNCRIHLRNNGRNLDTRFFATPVEGVTARQRRKDVELRIALKEPTSPTPRTEPGPDGSQFLVLDFPPGQPTAVPTK
jgi:hypothetical protein